MYQPGESGERFPRTIPSFDDLLLIALAALTGKPLLPLVGGPLLRFDCIKLLPKTAISSSSSLLKLQSLSVLRVKTDDLRAIKWSESLPIDLFPLSILETKKEGSQFWVAFISNSAVMVSVIRLSLSFHSSLFSLAFSQVLIS